MMTDASSLRRRESSSTIVSFYDKSKLPLSISQQTSASAIARGLPPKASSILDVDGTLSSPKKLKKKPSRLDLSYLLPKSRSAKHQTPRPDSSNGRVLGHDIVALSPSVLSVSQGIDPRSIRQLSGNSTTVQSSELAKARAAASTANLPNLYDHYEQRSFQTIAKNELDMTTDESRSSSRSPSHALPLQSTSTNDYLSPSSKSPRRAPFSGNSTPAMPLSGPDTPVPSLATPSSLVSLPADYAASVSSRHTRTSKASKRTDRSLVDFDLHQSSVLSLSSDSEDDYTDAPKPFISTTRRPSADSSQSPTSVGSMGLPQPSRAPPSDATRARPPRSDRLTPGNNNHLSRVESVPDIAVCSSQPRISERTSSLSISSATTKTSHSMRSLSRLSLASTVTARSATAGSKLSPSPRSSSGVSGVHEARAITMMPAQTPHYHSNYYHNQQAAPRRSSQSSTASDLGRGSLSPTSIDHYLQSPNKPLSLDEMSIRSGKSMASVASSVGSPGLNSPLGNTSHNGRLMTVTRQEEMLLAALRLKRARMRENIIAELEAENDSASEEVLFQHLQPQPQPYQYLRGRENPHQAPNQPLPPPPKNRSSLDRRSSSSRQGSRRASSNPGGLAPLHEAPGAPALGHQRQQQTLVSPRAGAIAFETSDESSLSDAERGRILLYYDRPMEKVDDTFDTAEPSPDLSDFMDYDDGNSEDLPLHTPSDLGAGSGSGAGFRNLRKPPRLSLPVPAMAHGNTVAQGRYVGESVSARRGTPTKRHHGEDLHVRIVGDANDGGGGIPEDDVSAGIPRPDSPISPAETSLPMATALSRKKQVRLSAVGYVPGIEVGLWADDG